uniref:Peptidyl-prolyl cis-trans isomerase D n=1 Tax=Schistocephalus solidus TaxID=70667 RepID=A0A0X3PTT1_SCHSO
MKSAGSLPSLPPTHSHVTRSNTLLSLHWDPPRPFPAVAYDTVFPTSCAADMSVSASIQTGHHLPELFLLVHFFHYGTFNPCSFVLYVYDSLNSYVPLSSG